MKYLLVVLFCVCLGFDKAYGQTCTGSLGDPIVNIDFGSGSSLHSSNTYQSITNYKYVTHPQVEDGEYTIKNSLVGDHPGGWWQTGDHTGGGYMMVVNASFSPGEFYRETITGLCPGTTYEFAAWILNLLRGTGGIRPNITFTIETSSGTTSFDTGDLANGDPEWRQHGTYFVTPAGSGSVTIIMRNNAPGGGGNDLAIDDITFRACGPIITSRFEIVAGATVNVCEGDNVSYKMLCTTGAGYTNPAFQWQQNVGGSWDDIPGATNTDYTAVIASAAAGTYQYRMVTAEQASINSPSCRVASNVLTVRVNTPPPKVITGPTTVCEDKSISFSAPLGDTFSWTGPNGFTSNLQTVRFDSAKPANSGSYSVIVTQNGCSTTIDHNITVFPKIIPTVTPNTVICVGDALQLQATGGIAYSWSPATDLSNPNIANPIASPNSDIKYQVTVTGVNGCFDTISVMVSVTQMPTANAGNDMIIYEGQSVTLNGLADGKTSYWTPSTGLSDATSLNPVAMPAADITYTLHSESGGPCNYEVTDQLFIRVYQKVIVPNTFTPNNDGVNDIWKIKALDTYPTANTQVFERKGAKIFETIGYNKPWDGTYLGKPLPAGVYFYKIDLKNGQILSGWVTIIR